MQIIYIHHGFIDKSTPHSQQKSLHKLGKKDVKLVAELLNIFQAQSNSIKAIYSSPYLRCEQTAKIANKHLKLDIVYDDRLNEIEKTETLVDLYARTREFVADIVHKYDKKDSAVCVTSGLNIVPFIFLSYNLPMHNDMPTIGVPSCSPIVLTFDKENFVAEGDAKL